MLVCGVDDAGRGSMVGPLVIAGVSLQNSKIKKLYDFGVRDSKKLSPKRREQLYHIIVDFADSYCIARAYPKTIDRSVSKHKLNHLEARYMAKVIAKLRPDVSYVDSCDVNPKRFGNIIEMLSGYKVKSYHHADTRFVIVSAASILAKVTRDRAIARLRKKHQVGSGYPSDSKTKTFVTNWITNGNEVPSFVRASWKPVKKILAI